MPWSTRGAQLRHAPLNHCASGSPQCQWPDGLALTTSCVRWHVMADDGRQRHRTEAVMPVAPAPCRLIAPVPSRRPSGGFCSLRTLPEIRTSGSKS